MSKRVLIHGSDATLLETRRQILVRDGLTVETTVSGSELASLIDSVCPDLLIVCSSLFSETRQSDVHIAHARSPKLKCLIIDSPRHGSFDLADTDTVFHAFDGPERFVKEVQKLLAA